MTGPTTPALVPEVGTLDPRRLARLRRFGILLDSSIPVPGTGIRFGLENLIGLVPGIGDLIGGALSLYIILEAHRMGAPGPVLARMGWNVAIDTLVGEVPILGDLFDVGFKANMRNLPHEHHGQRGREALEPLLTHAGPGGPRPGTGPVPPAPAPTRRPLGCSPGAR